MKNNRIEQIVKEVLDNYIGSQINIDSETARDLLAKHIAADLEYGLTEYKSLKNSHVDGCGYDD